MDFSPTKNVCLASTPKLAERVAEGLPRLNLAVARMPKSLGSAIGAGAYRNTQIQRKRLF